MEIIREKIEGDKRNLDSITLVENGKRMKFTTSNLGFLEVSFSYDSKKRLWIQENFDIDRSNEDLYKLADSVFFSYGDSVVFDSEDSNFLSLTKDRGKYSFEFNMGPRENDDSVRCLFIADTTENESLRNFFFGLQNVKVREMKPKEPVRTLKKSKKNIER